MTPTTFFRLLHVPIDAKGDALAERIAALNATCAAEETYTLDPAAFAQIPGSPFAYWVGEDLRAQFQTLPSFEPVFGTARTGLQSLGADEIFIRTWWEVPAQRIGRSERWVPFAKGGKSTRWWADVYLVTEWENDGDRQKTYALEKYRSVTRKIVGMADYYRLGLTYTSYTNKGFHVRILPAGCIFSLAGSAIFPRDTNDILWILALMNSSLLEYCLRLMTDRRKWEPGYVKALPIREPNATVAAKLRHLVTTAVELGRQLECGDETTHAFCLPSLVQCRDSSSLREASAALDAEEQARQARLGAIQAQIDDIVFDLYRLSEADRALVRAETAGSLPDDVTADSQDQDETGDEETEICNLQSAILNRTQDLLMWCVGVAFGRWDVRKALDPSLLPPLGGPFDPLPRHAPGALIEDDGLRTADALQAQSSIFNLQSSIPPDGILVDDPDHPSDIVRRVREVLAMLWGERAEAIEDEACGILGVKTLREYFRDPRRFFTYHIKRYSKSRRKAPIYWLLQSERRGYGIWLCYHRITDMTLYIAGRDYADGKIALERGRLDDLRAGLESLIGTARRKGEREIERQEKLAAEVAAFGKTLDQVALANVPPDPNDGVLISIAPLHPLVPWPEARRMWEALGSGQYGWSTMAKRMTNGR